MEDNIDQKMYSYYNDLLSKRDCNDLADDVMKALNEKKYNKLMMEWLNDSKKFSDVKVAGFSLVDVAKRLNEEHPNIPVAILLGHLTEHNSKEFQVIMSIAEEKCIADHNLVDKGTVCEMAVKKDGEWAFMTNKTKSTDIREYQMWQVLLLNPLLAPQVAYKHPDGTAIILEDEKYIITNK